MIMFWASSPQDAPEDTFQNYCACAKISFNWQPLNSVASCHKQKRVKIANMSNFIIKRHQVHVWKVFR